MYATTLPDEVNVGLGVPVVAAAGVDRSARASRRLGLGAGVADTGAGVAGGVWDCGAVEVQPARNAVASEESAYDTNKDKTVFTQ